MLAKTSVARGAAAPAVTILVHEQGGIIATTIAEALADDDNGEDLVSLIPLNL